MGELVSITYKPQTAVPFETGYTRIPIPEVALIAGYGIDGDTKGGSLGRQINVMTAETMQRLAAEGFAVGPGQLGEQLIVSGVDIDALSLGARVQIGDRACIEMTEPRTGCGKLERHQSKRKEEASGRLGMMARVVIGGTIRVGDPVQVIAADTNASE